MCGFEAGNAKNDRRNTKLKKSIILTLGRTDLFKITTGYSGEENK